MNRDDPDRFLIGRRLRRRRMVSAVQRRVENRRVAEDLGRRAVVFDLLEPDDRVRRAAACRSRAAGIAFLSCADPPAETSRLNSPLDDRDLAAEERRIGRAGGAGLVRRVDDERVDVVGADRQPDVELGVLLLAGVEAGLKIGARER